MVRKWVFVELNPEEFEELKKLVGEAQADVEDYHRHGKDPYPVTLGFVASRATVELAEDD